MPEEDCCPKLSFQIEFHPHLVQSDLLQWCQKQGIHFQAYSSLGTSDKNNKVGNQLLMQVHVVLLHHFHAIPLVLLVTS